MATQKVILFDLGGVLVENRGREGLTAMLPAPLETREIWLKWLQSPAVRQFERGLIPAEAFAESFLAEWQIELDSTSFINEFATWPTGLFDGAGDLLKALRARHHVACLSNTNAVHWDRLTELHSLFDSTFLSHRMGHVKPDPEAYEHTIAALGGPASRITFFDDLLPNVEAARAAGINAFHVAGFEDIAPILRREGLYPG